MCLQDNMLKYIIFFIASCSYSVIITSNSSSVLHTNIAVDVAFIHRVGRHVRVKVPQSYRVIAATCDKCPIRQDTLRAVQARVDLGDRRHGIYKWGQFHGKAFIILRIHSDLLLRTPYINTCL